jgi:outer membrane protein TolC
MKPDPSSLVIARLNADASLERFRSEVMATVRSVVELYWNLAEVDAAVWAAEQSVNLARDVVDLEQALLSPDKEITPLADAALKLEQFQELLTERRQSAEKSERQLRNAIALPPHDNWRIIPSDQPVKEHLVFDWQPCLDALKQTQPDVLQQKAIVAEADRNLTAARKAMVDAANQREARRDGDVNRSSYLGMSTPLRQPLANTRQRQYALLRAQELLDQVIVQTTESLTRAIAEADSAYRQYAEASRLRNAAEVHLKAQRVDWNEGRITAGRFLEAVDNYAELVTDERHDLASYNSALAHVSECKGTLLEDRNIIVAGIRRLTAAPPDGTRK